MITEVEYIEAAKALRCEVAMVKAVKMVESSGNGFLSTGEPLILFEPHIFWKRLKVYRINPENFYRQKEYKDILYPSQGMKPYGLVSEQHNRLKRAATIHREAALESASWGLFQIMGYNWEKCNCKSLQDYINKVYTDENTHLNLFVNYILHEHLDDELRLRLFTQFARIYNGKLYYKHGYDKELKKWYNTFKGI